MGATVEDGWFGAETGELSEALVGAGVLEVVEVPPSLDADSEMSVVMLGFT